ncbi:hypothetical protein PHISCL_01037 [Aspergillus sclerotialis]|uniref:P-loop containing nucleoside triphosphate hydrolase protein n=1 Tax=Aspergillus sclerotialis TaxID=2070753 RepID=A0A3A2ZWB2_9EURO|nr:hypothetical protein PHISCL_01037 [Aspergillus sclerotialis]
MSREIDRLPEPAANKRMRVVIASCSRTGTLGLYTAMKTLGFTSYHIAEAYIQCGLPHMKVFEEALIAQCNLFSGKLRYNKSDLEKWLGGYDCLIEVPSYLGTRVLELYAEDPDVKFILTQRNPDKWVRSMNQTVGELVNAYRSFPINILKYFDDYVDTAFRIISLLYFRWSSGTNPGDPNNELALRTNYIEYIEEVKKVVPKDRLLVVNLEDGLGWEEICPFLDVPIPQEPYPRGNEKKTFDAIAYGTFGPKMKTAALRLAATVVPFVGIGAFYGYKYFRR